MYQRWSALDRLRGVALVGMLIHHLTEWMAGDARAVLPGWRSFALTDVAAVAFFVAAGASLGLFVSSRRARGLSRRRVAAQVLRRYGLLVPIGVTLDWVFWRHPSMFGVLEALGFAVVVAAAVAAVFPDRLLDAAAAITVAGGMVAERLASGQAGWWADELLAGKFPAATYVGFVLVGVAVVRSGRYADERWAMAAAGIGVAATAVLLVVGVAPDRYPGDLAFVGPGLAGTAVSAAVAVATALCLVAPRIPQPPWSARTGLRRPPRPAPGGAGVRDLQLTDAR